MAGVFHSRGKLMLRAKSERQHALAGEIPAMLGHGCEAYGTFYDDELQAFCLFFPWPDLPFSTCVLVQSRPVTGPVNFQKNGLAFCMDAALASLESRGYTQLVFRRTVDARWRRDAILRNSGRMSRYAYSVVERIAAGNASRWERINRFVLNNRAVEQDTAIVIATSPEPA